ncbi:MAG: tetratricopeptide repeat protein [Candidatus Omnitrophota bacterium]
MKTIVVMIFLSAILICPQAFCDKEGLSLRVKDIERSMLIEGNYKDSAAELKLMLESSPFDARVCMNLAVALYGLMEYEHASEYFKKSENMDNSGEFKELRVYAMSKIEKNKGVLNTIESAKERNLIMSGHLVMLNKLMGAKYYYPAIVMPHVMWLKQNTPDVPGIYELSGNVYYSAMLYGKAIEDYEKAVTLDLGNIQLYKVIADCQTATGKFDEAGENYQKAINLYLEKEVDEDNSEVSRLKKIKQALPKKYEDIADLINKRRLLEAEEICKRRISLNPGDYAAITQLGQVFWEKKNRKAAVKLFKRAVKMAPDYPISRLWLGKAYFFEQKFEKGVEEFSAFKEKMKTLPKMDKGTIDFYVSTLHYLCYMYSTVKEYDKALEECKGILKIKPDDQTAHYNTAVSYYTYYHNRSLAYSELQKVIEIDSTTNLAGMARYYIDYMRRNADSRVMSDFSFVYEE